MKAFSDDNSVLSGDDENGWELEEARMMDIIISQNEEEEEIAGAIEDDPIGLEVYEFEEMISNDIEWGAADEVAGEVVAPAAKEIVTHTVQFSNKYTLSFLKELYVKLGLGEQPAKGARKRLIFDRIRDSGKVHKINDDSFSYEMEKEQSGEQNQDNGTAPYWVILSGTECQLPDGFDASGAECGYYAPTNQDNHPGAPKLEYLTRDKERIVRPAFGPKQRKSGKAGRPVVLRELSDVGGPSSYAMSQLNEDFASIRPKDLFSLQLTEDFFKNTLLKCTNARAAAEGAGSSQYKDFAPFDLEEIYKFTGILFANAVCPKPQLNMWFKSTRDHKIYGNEMFQSALDKKVNGSSTKISGERRWRHFRQYMCLYDFRKCPKKLSAKDPFWKVHSILDELRKNAQRCWVTGKCVSIDEQTIGFKGQHGLALRITYKREGDGYQCDAVCEDGYTFSFCFRHGDPPDLPDSLKQMELSPTARRVIWLMMQLPNKWTRVYMDNLFNSRKLFTAAYSVFTLCHGVVRTNGRGIADAVIMKEEKTKEAAKKMRGATKAALLKNNAACPDLLVCSVYDTKPVHMMSTVAESIEWIEKKRKVWSSSEQKKVQMRYLRLNLINDYNENMNNVDLADQLRNCYRFNHWFRNRKWWWSIYLWSLGVAATNAFVMYLKLYEVEAKKHLTMPKKWTHLEFLVELIYDFMGWTDMTDNLVYDDESTQVNTRSRSRETSVSLASTGAKYNFGTDKGRLNYCTSVKTHSITLQRMNSNWFHERENGRFHPSIPNSYEAAYCQYCRFKYLHKLPERSKERHKWMVNHRNKIQRCLVCNVNLCWDCFNKWHGFGNAAMNGIAKSD